SLDRLTQRIVKIGDVYVGQHAGFAGGGQVGVPKPDDLSGAAGQGLARPGRPATASRTRHWSGARIAPPLAWGSACRRTGKCAQVSTRERAHLVVPRKNDKYQWSHRYPPAARATRTRRGARCRPEGRPPGSESATDTWRVAANPVASRPAPEPR